MVELNMIDSDEDYRNKFFENYKKIRKKLSEEPKESLASIAEKMLNP